MTSVFPKKLKKGDHVRVIAPARSMAIIGAETRRIANERLAQLGLRVSFGIHAEESDAFASSSIASRVQDLHDAFQDPGVHAVMTVIGGFNSNQLLDSIDWDIVRGNPKIFCGYSDITALQNAMYAKTGLVTYYGPHYSSFGELHGFEYTLKAFQNCVFSELPFDTESSKSWSDDAWYLNQENRTYIENSGPYLLQPGTAEGTILGGNLGTFNLLQGTQYFPSFPGKTILFLEDDEHSNLFLFERQLQSLIQQPRFSNVHGIVIGRFQKNSKIELEDLKKIVQSKKRLNRMPIIANADFGHTSPMLTIPVGGVVKLIAESEKNMHLKFLTH